MESSKIESKKYNIKPFLDNLFEWIDSFKIDDKSGNFSVFNQKLKPSLYGICDMVYNLVIPNELDSYFQSHEKENTQDWIDGIQSYQKPMLPRVNLV